MAVRRPNLADESGFSLIEVVISAVVLLMVTMGTLTLIDGAAQTTTQNRARTAAADLAEQDQEALRATAAVTLGGSAATGRQGYTPAPRTATVGGVDYTVTSSATWVRDSTGAVPSCTDSDGIAEYLKLTSTVSAPRSTSHVAPVTITSLLTPTAGSFGKHTGSLTVQIKDRSATGLSAVPVTLTGPQNATQSTNAAGCALFNYFPSGAYTASWFKSGFVDYDGVTNPSESTTIVDAASTRISRSYDLAGGLTLNIKTKGDATSTASEVTVANARMAAARTFPETGALATPASSIATGPRLFPFTDGYSVYTGDCAANSPTGYTGETTATVPSLTGGSTPALTVYQPTITAQLQKSGAATSGLELVLTPSAADQALGCATKYRFTSGSLASGVNLTAGLPYGHYTACVDDGNSGTSRSYRPSTVWTNGSLNSGLPLGTLNIPSSGYVTGACP